METERNKTASDSAQINFKLSSQERETIEKSAENVGVTLSEYCRIKCLLDEDQAFALKMKVVDLEKKVKELQVKQSFYKDTQRDPYSIVLQLQAKEREIFEKLFNHYRDKGGNLGWNIVCYIIDMICEDERWLNEQGFTTEDIADAF